MDPATFREYLREFTAVNHAAVNHAALVRCYADDVNSAARFSAIRVGSYGLSGVPDRTVTHGALTPARCRPMVIATAFHHATY